MRTRTGKRILAVLLSAVTAVCTAGTVQAEEGIVLFTQEQEEGDYARADGSDAAEAEILSEALEISDTEPEAEKVTEEPARDDQEDPGGADVELVSVEEVAGEIGLGESQASGETVPDENQTIGEDGPGESLPSGETVPDEISAPDGEASADGETTYSETRTFRSGDAGDGAASRIFMRSTLEYECAYGDQLVGESRRIYDAFVNGWAGGSTDPITYRPGTQLPRSQVNVDLTFRNVQMAYDAFVYDYPEVFWLREVQVSINSGSLLTSVYLNGKERYTGAKSEVKEFEQAVRNETDFIRSSLPEDADRYTIVKAIHDHICETTTYDDLMINCSAGWDTAHTAAGIFLKDRIVVCEGYAKAFKILCRQFGIGCALVIGNAGGNHMWNYVKMDDGKWYLVDATWDDQKSGIRDTYLLAGSMSYGFHENLIMSERQAWTDFSGSGGKQFVLPPLSAYAYERKPHEWKEISSVPATCQSYATADYVCELCGETKTEIVGPETAHDWGPYSSNHDASWQKDGTKTAVCRYGCGTVRTVTDVGSRLTARLEINPASLRLKVKQSTSALKVTLVNGDKIVSWKSNRPAVASVNSAGKITAGTKTGKAVITAATLSGLTKKITVTVQKGAVETTGITGLSKNVTLKKGAKLKLSPVIRPVTSLQKVTYASSNQKIAAVTARGVITAKKAGTAKITVKSGKKKFIVTVKVKKA